MPSGRNGNHLVDFEKMEGQNIDMNTEYEKNLENQALTATSIPPLLVEQYNQADFSKAYTTAHMGFAAALAAGVIPFILGDLAKIIIAMIAGPVIRKQLKRAGLN